MNTLESLRRELYRRLNASVHFRDGNGVMTNADKDNRLSVELSKHIAGVIGHGPDQPRPHGNTLGKLFERHVAWFVMEGFGTIQHLRPGRWRFTADDGAEALLLGDTSQYSHLAQLRALVSQSAETRAALGNDYEIAPDILVARETEDDHVIAAGTKLLEGKVALAADIRKAVSKPLVLHASISCKWTLRSDRAQNARSEALNLIRNRKGRAPHIVVVTAEPLPSRLASLALGTGDLDCVYHLALGPLMDAVAKCDNSEAQDMLHVLTSGRRLKDISDLPLDLAI